MGVLPILDTKQLPNGPILEEYIMSQRLSASGLKSPSLWPLALAWAFACLIVAWPDHGLASVEEVSRALAASPIGSVFSAEPRSESADSLSSVELRGPAADLAPRLR